jgi:hypothetical protein
MEQALILGFNGGYMDPKDLPVRPIDIIRDMIADVELYGYAIQYHVERDTPSQAAISYDAYSMGGIVDGRLRVLPLRVASPAIKNRDNSLIAALAFAADQIGTITADFMDNTSRSFEIDISSLIGKSWNDPNGNYRIIVHDEQMLGNVVLISKDDEEVEMVFHPYNSITPVSIPSFVGGIDPGDEFAPDVRTITVQMGNFVAMAYQELFIPYKTVLKLLEERVAGNSFS